MPFVTKVDYSDNRQVKQFQLTNTKLSGTTVFGVDYSGLTGGVDVDSVVTIGTYSNIASTFSGNSNTTNFTFGQPEMISGAESLVPITSANSGDTQVGLGYEGINPTTIDGNNVFSSYTGSTFDLSVTSIEEISPNIFTGTTNSNTITLLSGDSTDFSDRTIWADVKGITRTKRLILTDELDSVTGNTTVLGRDTDGNVVGITLSGLTGSTGPSTDDYTTGSTLSGTILEFTRLSGGTYNVDLSSIVSSGGNGNDYVTGSTFNTTTGDLTLSRLSGGTVVENLDGRYLTGFTIPSTYLESGDNISELVNDVGYITGFTDTFVTGFTYNPSNNNFTITRNEGLSDLDLEVNTFSGLTITNELVVDNISGNTINPINSIQFNTGFTPSTSSEGLMYWDVENQTLSVDLHTLNGPVSLQLGQESYYLIKNQSGSTIDNGKVIRAAGTLGNSSRILGEYMIADGSIPPKFTLGVSTQSIPNGEDGYVTEFGFVKGIDTTGSEYGETWNDGDILWVSATNAGGFTNIEPLPPFLKIEIAIVIHTHPNGIIFVRPNRYPYLYDLQEINYSAGTENNLDILQWNSNSSVWDKTNTPNFNSISATTISGDTIFSGGTNLTDIFLTSSTDDYTITATTSGSTIEFTRLSGGTFNVDMGLPIIKQDDGNGIGYVLADRDPSKFSPVGKDSIDLTQAGPTDTDLNYGVESEAGFSVGFANKLPATASNFGAHSAIGYGNTVQGYYGNLAIGTFNEVLNGYNAATIGYSNSMNMTPTIGHGFSAGAFNESTTYWNNSLGVRLINKSKGTTVFGISNTDYSITGATDPNRPIFIIGNGDASSNTGPTYGDVISRSDAVVVKLTGEITVPSTEISDINNAGLKSLITLEYLSGWTGGFSGGTLNTDDFTTGATFNTSTGLLEFTRQSGDTYNVDLDGRYLTGFTIPSTYLETGDNISELVNDVGYVTGNTGNWDSAYDDTITGMTVTGVGTKTITLEQRDGGTVTANFTDNSGTGGGSGDVVTGMTFNTTNGVLTLNTLSGDTITEDLDGRYLTGFTIPSTYLESGDNISELVNDVGYITGFTDTNDNDYVTSGTVTGSNLQLTRLSGGTVDIDVSSLLDDTNTDDYLTGHTFNTATGLFESTLQSGSTVNINLDGRYLLESDFNSYTGSTIGTDDYVTGSTFNTTTGDLTLSRLSGGTVVENLDGRYSLINTQENLNVDSGTTEVIATIDNTLYDAVFFNYLIKNGINVRAGIVMAVHNGSNVEFTDTSTNDLGDTSGVVFDVDLLGSNLRLLANTITDGWEIKVTINTI